MAKRRTEPHRVATPLAPVCAAAEIDRDKILAGLQRPDGRRERKAFANTASGHAAALRWWRTKAQGAPLHVCLEPTGTYSLDLALFLSRQPLLELTIPNPRSVRAFAVASMRRDKTDDIDLDVLLDFCHRMDPAPWRPPAPEALELRWITRRIAMVQKALTAEKNRLHAATRSRTAPPIVRQAIRQSIRAQSREIDALRRQAKVLIAAHPALHGRFGLLRTVSGFGEKSALALLGELAVLPGDMTARQWVAYAALYPLRHSSGVSVNKPGHVGKAGNKYLRLALFMPALTASRHQPQLRQFRDRLVARGLKPIQATVAVMRRLLHIVHALFRTKQAFDPQRVGARSAGPLQETTAA